MKSFATKVALSVLALSSLSFVAACGASEEGSQLAASKQNPVTTAPAIIQDLDVTPINGGFNPDAFAYSIEGRVMLGGNACGATGVTAEFKQEEVDGILYVTAYRSVDRSQMAEVCTREFMPVYADLQVTVRGFSSKISDVIVKNVDTMGNDKSVKQVLAPALSEEAILENVHVEPTNGGFNPDAFAYQVEATVTVGSNSCFAAGVEVAFEQELEGRTLKLRAVKTMSAEAANRICIMVYQPVSKVITTTLRGFSSEIDAVIIENVGQKDNDLEIEDLL